MMNRVWIELEVTKDGTAKKYGNIDNALNKQRAELASRMLKRLGVEGPDRVFWNEHKSRYCFVLDSSGAYVEASDHGHWFNLDWLGREEPQPAEAKEAV